MTMRAVIVTGQGGPEVLRLHSLPVPVPRGREVLIRIASAGVNRADLLLQAQQANAPRGWSAVPGLEVAGIVEAVGPAARGFSTGDKVMALSLGGGYAEFCAVDERLVLPWPDALSAQQASGVPEAVATIWTSLLDRGKPRAGEWVLINGGASVIGALSIAIARSLGCRVLATAGSPEKCAACRGVGADEAFDYRDPDLVAKIREAGGGGVDLILDMGGGDTINRNVAVLRPRGRMVMIGMMSGQTGRLDIMPLMAKRASVLGSTLFFRTLAQKGAALRRGWRVAETLLDRPGGFPLHIDREFSLGRAADAQRHMNDPAHRGKTVIRP